MKPQGLLLHQLELRKLANKESAEITCRFFKTGPGEYGEGDIFIGCTVPEMRKLAHSLSHATTLADVLVLLESAVHEDRFLGLCLLVRRFEKTKDPKVRREVVDFYLKNRAGVDNWDLVDTSAYKILGAHCLMLNDHSILKKLARSKRHWDRRIAMVATFSLIRTSKTALTYELARQFLNDKEDLMHKATGWMLREAGKRNPQELLEFIDAHGSSMPRTMLRYSIEKFPAMTRKEILRKTRPASTPKRNTPKS